MKNSLIKNALVYKAELPSAATLTRHLEEHQFTDPLVLSKGSVGFISRSGEGLVDVFHGGMAFTVRIDEKIIPAAVVKAELEKRVKDVLEQTGRKAIGKLERADLKDSIILEFMSKALVKTTIVTCFYDTKNGYLIIPTTSRTVAGIITGKLISAVGSVKTETISVSDVKHGLSTRLQAWLGDDAEAFGDFFPMADVDLANGSQKLTVKMESLLNAKAGIEKAFNDGFTVKSVRLSSSDEVSFRLTHDFAFKAIKFPVAQVEENTEDAWLHEAAVQVFSLSAVVTELCEMLGYKEETQGEEPPAPHDGDGPDPLYEAAEKIVMDEQRASISLVQRWLKIGYNRAARLLEQMEVNGLVSPMQSDGSRKILGSA
jgi:recombination associated protein RdgC